MTLEYEYTNKDGIEFGIKVEKGDVPEGSDYFGFLLLVTLEEDKDTGYMYKAIVKKTTCNSEDGAKMWLNTTGIIFLYEILDTYKDGKTLILLPDSRGEWFIF